MYRPFWAFVGIRYTNIFTRKHYWSFSAFVSVISMFGIALGVAVLITVMSVMNGFSQQIRQKILHNLPHLTIEPPFALPWQTLLTKLQTIPEIVSVAPSINGYALLATKPAQPIIVQGITPDATLLQGDVHKLQPGKFGILLSEELVYFLALKLGDSVPLILPEMRNNLFGNMPRVKTMQLVGLLHESRNSSQAAVHLEDAKVLYNQQTISQLTLRLVNELAATTLAQQLSKTYHLPNIKTWTEEYTDFFAAIKMEKTVMCCILILIICVAVFNLLSSLVMTVNEKKADIAILRTIGASKQVIMGIFMVQGSIIGCCGTLIGLAGGIALARNVTTIVRTLEQLLQVQLISSNVYYVGFVPSKIQTTDVIIICITSMLLSIIATIYPAWRASRTQPAEALKYE
jgi:lipoprotein-releasing system permease protein